MKKNQALAVAASIARGAADRLTMSVFATSLFLVLALGGCWQSHSRPEPTPVAEPDAGSVPIASDAGLLVIDAGTPIIDADGDRYPAGVDCNDNDATIHPGAIEGACGLDGVDQNCDGWDYDEACEMDPSCIEWLCNG